MFHTVEFEKFARESPEHRVAAYDCSHWVMHEKPQEFLRDMRSFLI